MATTPDRELVRLALDQPGQGWSAIWDRHGEALHAYALRLLGERADAEDAVADAFVQASRSLDGLRDPDALRPWLYAIVRRQVQRRWRHRERTTPVDPMESTVMDIHATEATIDRSGEAATLLAEAAAGLSIEDRELLGLALAADLDTAEVGRITGLTPAAVSVKVSRLKDTLGRAAGAVLVARHHRRDCTDLDRILDDWDGTLDPLWRKRIARHIDGCERCETNRSAAAALALAAPMLVPAPSADLRDRVLRRISSTSPSTDPDVGSEDPPLGKPGDLDQTGFPVPVPWEAPTNRRRPLLAAAAAAALVVLALLGVLVLGGSDEDQISAIGGGTSTPLDGLGPGPAGTAASSGDPRSGDTTTSTTADLAAPSTTTNPAGRPTTTAPGPSAVGPTTTAPPTTTTPAPTVSMTLSASTIQTSCGSPTTTVATVTSNGQSPSQTVISWNGSEPGSTTRSGSGTHQVTIGPFSSIDDPDADGQATVTITAVITDAVGRTQWVSRSLTVLLAPC